MGYQKYKNDFKELLTSACQVEEGVLKLNESPDNLRMIDALVPEASHTVVLIRRLVGLMFTDSEEPLSCNEKMNI